MKIKTISIFTATRAEYHLLYSVIKKIDEDCDFKLDLIVSGTHLLPQYGYTVEQIEKDGFPINERINIMKESDNINQIIAKSLLGCSEHFQKVNSDFLVVLGDRYEILGAVIAASNALIPIAHIHGGETTEGAIDEAIRHAVTKFSYLHFACCDIYRNRIIQLGESPERVFNSGALGVENILNQSILTRNELAKGLNFNLERFSLVTFHPVTLEKNASLNQVKELAEALLMCKDMTFLITKSNADEGGKLINELWEKYTQIYPKKFLLVSSLGMVRYLSAMKHCELVIGNSSSGLLEAPSFKVPTINIGDRQRGRLQSQSIINCKAEKNEIINAMKQGLTQEFRYSISNMKQLYGKGNASEIIINELKNTLLNGVNIKKSFYDLNTSEEIQ